MGKNRTRVYAFHDCKSPQYFLEKKSKNTITGLELKFRVLMRIAEVEEKFRRKNVVKT